MKLGPLTKIDTRNKITSKNFSDDVMLANFRVIFILPIYDWFGAIQKPDSGRIIFKVTFSLNLIFYLTNLKIEVRIIQHSCHTIALSKNTIFTKNVDISNFGKTLPLKCIFSETALCVGLRTMFKVSLINLTSPTRWGWGEGVTLPPPPPNQNETLKSPPRLNTSCWSESNTTDQFYWKFKSR